MGKLIDAEKMGGLIKIAERERLREDLAGNLGFFHAFVNATESNQDSSRNTLDYLNLYNQTTEKISQGGLRRMPALA